MNIENNISRQSVRNSIALGAIARESLLAESKSAMVHNLSVELKESKNEEYILGLLIAISISEKMGAAKG